jgi:malonyl CoA-acyl carrier protein transacylase
MLHMIAAFFPGQGSQSVGMLDTLAESYPDVHQTFDEASDVLAYDLWRLVSEGPREELDLTRNTQPAMLAAGIAVWRVWQRAGGPKVTLMAGHSLGEYSALVAAGALSFADGLRLAAERLAGRLASVEIRSPAVPVLHNASVSPAADPADLRDLLVQQLYRPVRWVETVRAVVAEGVYTAIECGPGKVLAGLNKRIDENLTTLPIFDPRSLEAALEAIGNAES